MKKHVLSALVLLSVAVAASAQTEQGNFLVGGNLELNTGKNSTLVTVNPSAGYFFIENFAAGANVGFTTSKVGDIKSTAVSVGPFARYYFGTMNVRPFAHADLGFTSAKTKLAAQNSRTETGSNYFLGGGLAAFINRNVAIEGLVGYRHTALKDEEGSGGFNLRVGFQVYLSKRQVERLTQ